MRGAWRPFVTYGGIFGVVFAYMVLVRGGFSDPLAYVALPLSVVPFVALAFLQGVLPVRRFLRGLAEGGESVEVLTDEVGWFGGRTVVARGARGEWRVEGTGGKQARLEVQAPGEDAPRRVRGNARKAGRAAAEAALLRPTPDIGEPEPPAERGSARGRVAVLLLVAFAVLVVVVLKAGWPTTPAAWTLVGAAAAVVAVVAVVAFRKA